MTKVVSLYGVVVLAACGAICGCRPEVKYSPPKAKDPGAETSAKDEIKDAGKAQADTKSPAAKNSKTKTAATEKTPPVSGPDLIAFDEFDGVNRGGWKEPGLGEWKSVGEEHDGALVVSGDFDIFRALAAPVKGGTVWYAVTMHMEKPVTGFVTLTPSEDGKTEFIKMGFSAKEEPYTPEGFWLNSESETGFDNTKPQTFLTRCNFDLQRIEGYSERDDGLSLVGGKGVVLAQPSLYGTKGKLKAQAMSHMRLHKSGPEKLVIDRIAIARNLETALYPQGPVRAPRPAPAAPTESPKHADAAEPKKAG